MNLLAQVIEHPRFSFRESEYIRWYPKTLTVTPGEPTWQDRPLGGAYIHVPFCDKICKFCPFNKTVTSRADVNRYVAALVREIEMLSRRISQGPLRFVYFGGGTPSVLTPAQISSVLEEIDRRWGLSRSVEVTLETHPTHAKRPFLLDAAAAGVNRVSIGIQSFQDHLLSALGATHVERDSKAAVDEARSVFDNVAIDLLYRYHPQTPDGWQEDLRAAVEEYRVPHISCYALVPISSSISQPSEEAEVELAIQALAYGQEHGLHHYASCASGGFDIAQPDNRCRYELEHWAAPQSDFVGLGPGAFGFAGGHSTVNRLNVNKYCGLLERGRLPLASAVRVDAVELRHRFFTLGLKALEIPLSTYRSLFGSDPLSDFAAPIRILEREGLASVCEDTLRLTPLGRLYVDTCSTLFFSATQRDVPHPEEPEIRAVERLLAE